MSALCLIRVEMETKRAPLKVSFFLIEDFTQAIEINPVKIYARVSFKLVVLLLSFYVLEKEEKKKKTDSSFSYHLNDVIIINFLYNLTKLGK